MALVFEVESEDITRLNSVTLTKLLKMLLHLEARSAGIAERAIEVALNITVADGGEDGRIEWNGEPDSTDFLPSNLVQFQNKASELGPADCAKELVDSKGRLKKMIQQCLDRGGAYALFTTQELNGQQKNDRIIEIRRKLRELGKDYADKVIIEIFDAAKIQGWTNRFVPAITAVLNWVGRPLIDGLVTLDDWKDLKVNRQFDYIADEFRQNAIRDLRLHLALQQKCSRIIGLSGLGKTRLAFEICKGPDDYEGFGKRVIYINAAFGIENLPGIVHSWVMKELDGLLVVDNCDLGLHKQLRDVIDTPKSKLSLLTLNFNPEKDPETNPIQLKPMSDASIKEILEQLYKNRIDDLERIASFAQGFPQMAVLLANARLDQNYNKDMGSLTDDDLVNKMLWGGGEPNPEKELILQACSLFDFFGFEGEREEEAIFIAENIAGTNVDTLYKCIKHFEERGIVNRAGRLAQIMPKPLAIRLAADWWRSTRPQRQTELIETPMPGSLDRRFCDQIARLDFLPEVKEFTRNLCGSPGPFGQAEVILSERGSRLFRSLVEVNPEATSETLHNILSKISRGEIKSIDGDTRRNLVVALEKLSYHASAFNKSAQCLMWLAISENEDWANNATGVFLQLFRTFLSGTEAPPSARLSLIDEALNSNDTATRAIAVRALGAVIDTYGGSKVVGAEYQGSATVLKEWRPEFWQEAFDYWIAALERLTSIVIEKCDVSGLAKDKIGMQIRGLSQRSMTMINAVDASIKTIVKSDGPLWLKALESIKHTLEFDKKSMPDEAKAIIESWVDLLTPTDIGERIKLIVSLPPWEHQEDESGKYIDVAAQNAVAFAKELSNGISQIVPYIPNLVEGEQRQAWRFGRELIIESGLWQELVPVAAMAITEQLDNPNISFILGLFSGVFVLSVDDWETLINSVKQDEFFQKKYPTFITTGKISESHLKAVVTLTKEGKIVPEEILNLSYGGVLKHLDPKVVGNFADKISQQSERAAWIALDVLIMFCHGDKDKWDCCENVFKRLILNIYLNSDKLKNQMNGHHWKEVADKLLKTGDVTFAQSLTKNILSNCNDKLYYNDLYHYIKPILRVLLRDYGKDVWSIVALYISKADTVNEYYFSQMFLKEDSFGESQSSVIEELSEDLLRTWCKEYPETAPSFVAQSTNVYLEEEGVYVLSPTAQYLLDNFGNQERVLSALEVSIRSFGWKGSVADRYKKEIPAFQSLSSHPIKEVKEWAKAELNYLCRAIESESQREEEGDWGLH